MAIQDKKILSVVTARGGSKGIPNKNLRYLGPYPLFAYSVFASLESQYVDLTVVSSDSAHIERLTLDMMTKQINNYGILDDKVPGFESSGYFVGWLEFVHRPDEISGDLSKNEEALIHACEYCKKNFDFEADIILNLQPTSPIRNDRLADQCIEKMVKENADSLFTASSHTPFFFRRKDGQVVADWDIKNRKMRQELSPEELFFHDNGSIYLTKKELLFVEKCRLGGRIVMVETDKYQSLQIDEESDFAIVEKIVESLS
jgi:N-acylneuraminate cytidylyltransferase